MGWPGGPSLCRACVPWCPVFGTGARRTAGYELRASSLLRVDPVCRPAADTRGAGGSGGCGECSRLGLSPAWPGLGALVAPRCSCRRQRGPSTPGSCMLSIGLIASCAVTRACWDQCPGIGRAPGTPGLTRGRGAAAAGRRRPRAVRPSVRPRPPAAAQQRPLPARRARRSAGARGRPAALPAGPAPLPPVGGGGSPPRSRGIRCPRGKAGPDKG